MLFECRNFADTIKSVDKIAESYQIKFRTYNETDIDKIIAFHCDYL